MSKATSYYVPHDSKWPILASCSLLFLAVGAANFVQQSSGSPIVNNQGTLPGGLLLAIGLGGLFLILTLWWRDTIKESLANMNSVQMDTSYRMGMMWFIFSEVMFFAAFFGALFYARIFVVPWLGGEGKGLLTNEILHPGFVGEWPLLKTPDGRTTEAMGAWGLPAINTAILLTSSVFCTLAHHALVAGHRSKQIIWLFLTVALGFIFLGLQALEYHHAYAELGLTLESGIYGSTFFLLTGFHGFHVTMGATMLLIMLIRSIKGHLTPDNHFAFEAAAWYWHFVDVVWVFLFIFVYWL
ncbi:MAG: cytochrome c oxidase subunit 3 [Pseudomonadales bacterium]|nr:cytochrome c oxidase subunit 3 [Pseudomonadales bacterium]